MKHAFPTRPTRLALAVGAALSLAGTQALAADRAGRVLAASGTIVASTPGGTRTLSRGSRVYTGETIDTRDGRIQIRFIDGALVSLQPGTRFEVERYEMHDTSAGDADDGGNVLMRLFRGALRTITGAIDTGEDDQYRLETPVATIGVRGTNYGLQYCEDGSCGDAPDGLYGHVTDGNVYVGNQGGDGIFGNGLFFRVGGGNEAPRGILEPPEGVLRDEEQEGEGEGGDGVGEPGDEGGSTSGPPTGEGTADEGGPDGLLFSESDETGVTATSGITAAVAGSLIGSGVSEGGVCNSPAECSAQLDDNGNMVLLSSDFTSVTVGAGASLVDTGKVAALDATFGRWTGGAGGGDFMWAYSSNPTTTAELSNAFSGSGTIFFSSSNGPPAVGTSGTFWTVSANINMDYNAGTAMVGLSSANLDLNNGNTSLSLINQSDIATIDPANGDLGFDLSLIDPGTCGTAADGTLQAVFAGDGGEGLIVEFEVRDLDEFNGGTLQETIRGVKILEDTGG